MCTMYEITNVWNELGCLQPPLPLRCRHQHPDLPWWVLHSLVWWVCMLVTYILVCKYVCEYDVILKYLLTIFMLVRRWRCKSLRSWKATMQKVMQKVMHMMTTSTPRLLLYLIQIQMKVKVSRVHDVCMYVCAYTSIYAFSLVTYKYILSVICIHNTTHMIYSFICTYIRASPASSPARWRCSTTLANSPAFAARWMEACAWRQPSMSSSRCTLYNHHHYHPILLLPLLPPLACVWPLYCYYHYHQTYHTLHVLLPPLVLLLQPLLSPTCGCEASFKLLLESVRVRILSYDTYMQLQMDVTFIKQVHRQKQLDYLASEISMLCMCIGLCVYYI